MRFALLLIVAVCGLAGTPIAASAQAEFSSRGMPYDAFNAMPKDEIEVPGGVLRVGIAEGELVLPKLKILDWIARSARAVSIYFGRFPVREARVLIVPVDGWRVRGGQAFGYRGAAIRIRLGHNADEDALKRDWVMVHEMIHLGLPDLGRRHDWLSEGMAVYVESIARVQAGDLTDNIIWRDFLRDMQKGLPAAGDRGLDHTPTWGRKYWGGALFLLLADIEIRKRSGNRYGLQDALRAVVEAGGTHEENWPITRVIEVADRAIGMNVLAELYERHRATPVHTDLVALWKELGVRTDGTTAIFDANAPLAQIRASLTKPPARN